ncbi:sigma-70 family RNA polymerase sigma factor [Aurantiacibacter poecillastricola]|uniref:sigma-70 family RNA polymerase sigma factor n=1 Tax=Aurantiacibacter poecillastricola TaxID=3064385 RepID=UPI0027400CC6|nr:sigma-70 family RNA polymerase sigma factor [Aurantiacibacter sp. 219JJ12-13]MDP5263101.1 sigma-70 family RNA polymerase sigma factor [Aurantiacibacter sp. 219JJ12-13]
MKHEPTAFAAAAAYKGRDIVSERVQRFVPMVRKAAWHINGAGRDGIEIEDLMQAGFIALTEAARNHEGPGEDGFAAYAKLRVRGAMFDLIRKSMPVSRGAVKRKREIAEARREFTQLSGREPSHDELAALVGLTSDELAQHLGDDVQIVSMDSAYDEASDLFASDLPDPFALVAQMQDNDRLGEAMVALPDRLKLVLQLYFVEELNLTEIAQVLEVSVPRVHQLKAQALVKIRQLMEDDG